MKRRNFLLNAGAAGTLFMSGVSCTEKTQTENRENKTGGTTIAGLTLKQHREELWGRLFDEYLPFWDHGGYDEKYGGFICNLDENGVPVDDQKFIWYQGRGIWVYSFLYNNIKKALLNFVKLLTCRRDLGGEMAILLLLLTAAF